jgi:hypothetical protein
VTIAGRVAAVGAENGVEGRKFRAIARISGTFDPVKDRRHGLRGLTVERSLHSRSEEDTHG